MKSNKPSKIFLDGQRTNNENNNINKNRTKTKKNLRSEEM